MKWNFLAAMQDGFAMQHKPYRSHTEVTCWASCGTETDKSVSNSSVGAVSRSEAPTAPPPFTSDGAPAFHTFIKAHIAHLHQLSQAAAEYGKSHSDIHKLSLTPKAYGPNPGVHKQMP